MDREDIEQHRFTRFVSAKAGSRRWFVSDAILPVDQLKRSGLVGAKRIPRNLYDRWLAEYEEKRNA